MYRPGVKLTKLPSLGWVPGLICAGVIGLVLGLQYLSHHGPQWEVFRRLEWITYDWRMRLASARPATDPTHLGAVFIDEESMAFISQRFGFAWPWPRQLHGRLVKMLKAQGAQAIGFDIFFGERHPDDPKTNVRLGDGTAIGSDAYFAQQLRAAGNVVLAVMDEASRTNWQALRPADLFRTNAWALGHVINGKDADGVVRRTRAFFDDPQHGRIWHLGLVLAARALGADLTRARVEPGRVELRCADGQERVIPVDADGCLHINWTLAWNDPRITKGSFAETAGLKVGDGYPPDWHNKLVVVGSLLSGNNVADVGPTSLSKNTYLVSIYWNVAHSVITGQFVTPPPIWLEYALIVALGLLAAALTWSLRPPWPSAAVLGVVLGYTGLAVWLFGQYRFWLPLFMPVGMALLINHVGLVSYQVVFEQREKRRVKGVFAKLVSPNVVNELLEAKHLNLGGTRRRVTVMFADIRGFTGFTDDIQAQATEYVCQHALSGAAAEAYYNTQARLTLDTVNAYMGVIADQVKQHSGTLDKYIGDCVMAYWGAPTPNDQHALGCVRAAIASQQAIHDLNLQRRAENQHRERANAARLAAGQPPWPLLPLLALGTGINTGLVIVGMMGSDAHGLNYTVFGREVNLASRLEGVSGRSRIVIGETTYQELQRDDPALARTCVELDPVTVKGIRLPVTVYEVPWHSGQFESFDTAATYPRIPAT